jgi:hypothetical protein
VPIHLSSKFAVELLFLISSKYPVGGPESNVKRDTHSMTENLIIVHKAYFLILKNIRLEEGEKTRGYLVEVNQRYETGGRVLLKVVEYR